MFCLSLLIRETTLSCFEYFGFVSFFKGTVVYFFKVMLNKKRKVFDNPVTKIIDEFLSIKCQRH